jgi:hypothetical protein
VSAESPFDPANDPPVGNELNPREDFGRSSSGPWHALREGWGTRIDAVCGVRVYTEFRTRRGRPDDLCPDCAEWLS